MAVAEAARQLVEYAQQQGAASVNQKTIGEHATPVGVIFPYVRREPTFGFWFDVDWNSTDRAAVRFVHGAFAEVGRQSDEKALRNRVVMAVPAAAHRMLQIGPCINTMILL